MPHEALPPAGEIEDSYPLSSLQQGMLFNTLLHPGSGVDVEQLLCELDEVLDVPNFQRAWNCVVARHPVLRTSFVWEGISEPRQEVYAMVELPWEEQDWRGIDEDDREERIAEWLSSERRRGFDLSRAPLFRLILVRFGEAEYQFLWTLHHAVLDGRSYEMVLREAFAFYDAFQRGEELSLPLPRPYRDFIEWKLSKLPEMGKHEVFWREALKGFTAATPLAVDPPLDPPKDVRSRKGTHDLLLSAETTSALRALAQDNEITFNTLVQGAWALVLSRLSGEKDVVFGVVRANRRSTVEGAESMIGLFVNTQPLRVQVDPEAELVPWLKQARQQWMAMLGRDIVPLVVVQEWSELPQGSPLFQSTMMFENHDLKTDLQKQGGPWLNRRVRAFSQTNYPIDLAAFDGTELLLRIDFDRRQVDDAAAGRMIGYVRNLLEGMARNPLQKLRELPILSAAERHQLLVVWNQTAIEFPRHLGIHELFEAQVKQTPDAIAVVYEDQHLTYRELNRRSNKLAHQLRELGVGPNVLVGICAHRSFEIVVGLLAILKAGGAYVPVDPNYPTERVEFMLEDAGAPIILVQDHLVATLPASFAVTIVSLDRVAQANSNIDTENLARSATHTDPAYMIYTSGSTGRPKGAIIPHRAIVNQMQWMQSEFPMDGRDCVLQKTEFSFDVSVWEFFGPLIHGAKLVLARPDGHRDPAYLVDTIIRNRVTFLQLVPSLLRMLLDTPGFETCRSLRHVFCGGEAMPENIPPLFFKTLTAELHNMYGPTETAIDAVYHSIPREGVRRKIPIGRPLGNTRAYILDENREPVPIGVAGELYIGGIQVGDGYHKRPDLTAKFFIPDEFGHEPGARLYRTGDKVRFLADGNIDFIGRIDHQIKIRGFRVELAEIELALKPHPDVKESLVMMREDMPDDQRIVAYVIPINPSSTLAGELSVFLKQSLPAYMVPSAFVLLDGFPLTPNGKLDRNALPMPDGVSSVSSEPHLGPRTPTEEALVASWAKILKLERVGVRHNFFDLGGHSLMFVRLISDINSKLNTHLGVPELFQNPTVEKLGKLIDSKNPTTAARSVVVQMREGRGEIPVYFIFAGAPEFRVAHQMGKSHPVYGVEARWSRGWRNALAEERHSDYPSLEQVVAPYAEAIFAHNGGAPCVIAGFSLAALMAYEAAHQIQKLGGKVENVILMDATIRPPSASKLALHIFWQCWKWPTRASSESKTPGRWRTTVWLLGKLKQKFWPNHQNSGPTPTMLTGVVDDQSVPLPWELLERFCSEIDQTYDPARLECRGTLFRTSELDGGQSVHLYDKTLGWENRFTKGLEIIPISGDHYSIFREQIPTIALGIDQVLKRDHGSIIHHSNRQYEIRSDSPVHETSHSVQGTMIR